MLAGYKTYIVAAAIAAITAANYLGYIDDETAKTLIGLLVGGGLATLRAAVDKR